MKYRIWQVPASRWSHRWVVIRPDLTIVRYYRTFEQARRGFIADAAGARVLARLEAQA